MVYRFVEDYDENFELYEYYERKYDYIDYFLEKFVFSRHSGKGRDNKEVVMHKNRRSIGGHERKIATMIKNSEKLKQKNRDPSSVKDNKMNKSNKKSRKS